MVSFIRSPHPPPQPSPTEGRGSSKTRVRASRLSPDASRPLASRPPYLCDHPPPLLDDPHRARGAARPRSAPADIDHRRQQDHNTRIDPEPRLHVQSSPPESESSESSSDESPPFARFWNQNGIHSTPRPMHRDEDVLVVVRKRNRQIDHRQNDGRNDGCCLQRRQIDRLRSSMLAKRRLPVPGIVFFANHCRTCASLTCVATDHTISLSLDSAVSFDASRA